MLVNRIEATTYKKDFIRLFAIWSYIYMYIYAYMCERR